MGCIALSLEGEYIGVQDLEGKKPPQDISYTTKYTHLGVLFYILEYAGELHIIVLRKE